MYCFKQTTYPTNCTILTKVVKISPHQYDKRISHILIDSHHINRQSLTKSKHFNLQKLLVVLIDKALQRYREINKYACIIRLM